MPTQAWLLGRLGQCAVSLTPHCHPRYYRLPFESEERGLERPRACPMPHRAASVLRVPCSFHTDCTTQGQEGRGCLMLSGHTRLPHAVRLSFLPGQSSTGLLPCWCEAPWACAGGQELQGSHCKRTGTRACGAVGTGQSGVRGRGQGERGRGALSLPWGV